MMTPVYTVGPETPIPEVVRLRVERHISGVPVVGETGRPVGIVTRNDLLRAFLRTDAELEASPRQTLEELAPEAVRVEVRVQDGVLILSGEVGSGELARLVALVLRAPDGVVDVGASALRVASSPSGDADAS